MVRLSGELQLQLAQELIRASPPPLLRRLLFLRTLQTNHVAGVSNGLFLRIFISTLDWH